MKTVRFCLMNKKFDDQYTFDLQGYLSVQDFCSTFNLLNQAVKVNSPPTNKLFWMIVICMLWVIAIIANYFVWIYTKNSSGLVALPFSIVLVTLLFTWRQRVLRQRFEYAIINICNRINATENIRGINYRFSKNGSDLSDVSKQICITQNSNMKTIYSIVIEFDDRYNALSSQVYDRYPSIDFVTVPLYAHVNDTKKSNLYPNWKAHHYDEKFIIHQ